MNAWMKGALSATMVAAALIVVSAAADYRLPLSTTPIETVGVLLLVAALIIISDGAARVMAKIGRNR